MKVSSKSRYGLRAMVVLGKNLKRPISAKEIAREEKIPLPYLEKILNRFKEKGLVVARKGREGGYLLKKDPSKIKIFEVLEAAGEEVVPVACLKRENVCIFQKKCLSQKVWKKLYLSTKKTLNSLTLKDLYEQKTKK